ncbi:amino acid ABC transporter substrate-binding protein [Natrarchaeobius halalkaliphilus]|uniref:Amino acid ABC transporter substrate-binding protein n=1 Tax=Natrarchaeobius halalkaliphilus TaxID=1679091 RepID=A0A3N6LK23_9EURY|nr:ABC transporter substrate-binding protein [Natrarchaeobius halalkaliphilus]RQG86708.1 amino acid ABC transporter substrate-binding protein [Natrarchaeobius halalkaliphilus]
MTNNSTRRRFVISTGALGAAAIAGCVGDDEVQRAIGAATPQSGPLEPDGTAGIRGMEVAIEELTEELDEPIELQATDGEAAPDRAVSVARNMYDNNIPVITGTFSSDVSNVLSDLAEDEEVPFITSISVDPEIINEDDEYTFRMTGDTTQKLKGMAEFLEEEGVSGIAVIAADYSMGESSIEFFEERAEEYGMELVHSAEVPMETDNFVPEIGDLDTDEIDALFYPFPGGTAPTLISQTREQGLFDEVDIVIGHDSYGTETFYESLGDDLQDMYFWGVDLENEQAQQANERMQEMFDVRMDPLSLPYYDTIHLIAEVMGEQGSVDPQDIRNGLADIEYETASGWDVRFDQNGNNTEFQMIVGQWQEDDDGELAPNVEYTSHVVSTE